MSPQPLLCVTQRQQHSLIAGQEEGEIPAKTNSAGREAELSLCALLLPLPAVAVPARGTAVPAVAVG